MKTPRRFANAGYPLSSLQLFEGTDQSKVASLIADCEVLLIPGGQTLPAGSGNSARLFIVLSGAMSSVSGNDSSGGSDSSPLTVLPGECAGELSVLDEASSSQLFQAVQDSDVLVIRAEKLWQLIDLANGVARNLLRLLSFRVRAANAQIRRRQKLGEFYRQLSMVDGLTNLQNRAWLDDQLPRMIANAHTNALPMAIIMIDLDHFKRFNDTFGHQLGDHALQVAAKVLSAALRPTDFAVRYGGEEMMVILQHADQKAGLMVAQRLCERMRESVVFSDMREPLPHVTASFGLACLQESQDAAALMGAADAALYRAKHAGRDQVAE